MNVYLSMIVTARRLGGDIFFNAALRSRYFLYCFPVESMLVGDDYFMIENCKSKN
jgi:hypothetical protein